ncbi:g5260 [Coccomyxa viridis]|uniref:G5260 protein n=1 Tax=Coccomyxa viridis TaxID=1274662 RepID=A0ABP1FTS7_9CHLO
MTTVPSNPVAGDGASDMATVLQQHQGLAPPSPRSLSEGHQRSICSDGAAGSGRDSSSQRKKRRHPVARVKGNWLPEEDERLRALVKTEGEGQWSIIAKAFPGRIGKQCRERWHNQLRPDIKREAWTDSEELILIGFHLKVGNKWADIAKELVGRTENAVKNHWNATLRWRDSDQGGVTKLKEYMRGLNILPHKRKRKLPPDGIPRSPCTKLRSPRSPDGTLPGGRKRTASPGETPCSHVKRPQYFMRQLLEPANADDDHIPLYDYAFSAASNGPPPQGTPSHVLLPTATSTRRQLQPMLPAQESAISESTHFTGGQVLLPSGPVPKLEQFGGGVMHQATPPAKRPPLPSLDIPGAPCGTHMHVPHSTAHVGALTPRGRIDGLGWVKPQEDENLENALNALTYPESNPGMLNNWDPNLVSPALFSGAGASLGISPFQQALMNLTPNHHLHHTPRSSDGHGARTPLGFLGPSAALNVPALWALQDMSSASVRPPRTNSVVDPSACSMGDAPSPLSPDADAVVKDFIASPPALMPDLAPDADLLDSCPDGLSLAAESLAIPHSSSRNIIMFGEGVEAELMAGPYGYTAADAAAAIGLSLVPLDQDPSTGNRGRLKLTPVWEGEQVAESPYQRFIQEFAHEGVEPAAQDPPTVLVKTEPLEGTSSDHSASAPVPEDIQNIIRSMWLCDAPDEAPNDAPNEGDNKESPAAPREISPGEASSIIEALAAPTAPAKPGKRGSNGGTTTKTEHATRALTSASPPTRQLRSRAKTARTHL